MRKLKGPGPPKGESLEAALRRLKASPDSTKDLLAARLLLDARVKEITKECGGDLQAVAQSALAKSRANVQVSEIERNVLVVIAAMRVLAEIDKQAD
jgi:hypothetical protein